MFLEQIGQLEKENALLSKELREKQDVEEFESLEEEIRREQEVRPRAAALGSSVRHRFTDSCALTGHIKTRTLRLEESR